MDEWKWISGRISRNGSGSLLFDPIRGRVTITLETGSRNLPSNSDRTKAIRFGFGTSFHSSTRLALALIVSVVNG